MNIQTNLKTGKTIIDIEIAELVDLHNLAYNIENGRKLNQMAKKLLSKINKEL